MAALLPAFQDPVEGDGQPLAANVDRVQQTLCFLGAPLPPDVQKALKAAGEDARRIQKILDGYAHALQFRVGGKAPGEELRLDQGGEVCVHTNVAFGRQTPLETPYGAVLPAGGRRLLGDTAVLHQGTAQAMAQRRVEVSATARWCLVPRARPRLMKAFDRAIEQCRKITAESPEGRLVDALEVNC